VPRQRRRRRCSGPEPEGGRRRRPGLRLAQPDHARQGRERHLQGIEGAWTTNPTKWDNGYFDLLLGYEWELKKSPAGAWQWEPVDIKEEDKPVDAKTRPSATTRS
jgi:catalase-peroxidase